MSLSILNKSVILNGANSLAVAAKEGIIYRLQPVETMTEIKFHNFEKDKTKTIQLASFLNEDYKIVGVTVDFKSDDYEQLPDGNDNPSLPSCRAHVRVFSQDKATENLLFWLSSYPSYVNTLYINHNDTWDIKLSEDVNKITFRCVPVIIDNSINIA